MARAGLLMTTMERLAWRLVREHLPLRILDVPFELPKIELKPPGSPVPIWIRRRPGCGA